ncbi:MAG: TlpA disulfide reductase family protein [Burkholderiales bacterium]
MTKIQKGFLFVAVALASLAVGVFLRSPGNPGATRVAAPAPTVFEVKLANAAGGTGKLGDWKGQVLVVNFWATWCPPCLKEIPEFIQMQSNFAGKGLQFVGVAVDDPAKVQAYARQHGMNYPTLVGELDAMELGKALGNEMGALPYTVVFDRRGNIVKTELGGTSAAKLTPVIEPLL